MDSVLDMDLELDMDLVNGKVMHMDYDIVA